MPLSGLCQSDERIELNVQFERWQQAVPLVKRHSRFFSPQLGASDIVVSSTEIARVPVSVLRDLISNRARLFDAISKHHDPRSFVGMGQPTILIGGLGF